MGEVSQRIVDLLLLNRSIFTAEFRAYTDEVKDTIAAEQAQTRALIRNLVQQKGVNQATSASYVQSSGLVAFEPQWADQSQSAIQQMLLNSLSFPAMRTRQDEITIAYHSTFQWMFQEPSPEADLLPWTNFVRWLRSGNDVYWINGKAGSGKSTLVKYIFNDPRSSKALSSWSGTKPTLVANFYFWNGGTSDQRSQAGLLRSLLFQLLQHQPGIMASLFPEEYQRLQENSRLEHAPRMMWTLKSLQEALERLIQLPNPPMNMCFFIDGLDEFESSDEKNDYQYLADAIKRLAACPFAKICVSSRPMLVFEEAFRNQSGLRLQDFTTEDIRHYVHDKLALHPKVQELAGDQPHQRDFLVKEVSEKAQGVFLWVKLVVRSLLDGLGNHDHVEDLQTRLRLLPAELERLYRHMLMRVEPMYLRKASEVFELIRTARKIQDMSRKDGQRTVPVTVLQLALAMEDNPVPWGARDRRTAGKLNTECDKMRDRLHSWCAGLLEVPDFFWNRLDPTNPTAAFRTKISWEVAYLHRTARDFLESESVWDSLQQHLSKSFEPYSLLLKSTVRLYVVAGPFVPAPLGFGLFRKELLEPITQALVYAQRAEAVTNNGQYDFVEALDRIANDHLKIWSDGFIGHWSRFLDRGEVATSYDSFMQVAVAYDLCGYVLQKIDHDHSRFLQRVREGLEQEDPAWRQHYCRSHAGFDGIESKVQAVRGVRSNPKEPLETVTEAHPFTLLDIALRPSFRSIRMVRILLEHGADPNEVSNWDRNWEHVLHRAEISFKQGQEGKKWLQVIGLFLAHGVDIRGLNLDKRKIGPELDSAKETLLNVIESFRSSHPADVESLIKEVHKCIPWSRRRRMKKWSTKSFKVKRSAATA